MSDDHVFGTGAEVLGRLAPDGAPLPWQTLADVAPVLGHEVGHAFGAVMSRPGLDLRTRELLTICMLAAIGGCEPQVAFHVGGALRAGATAPEIVEALTQVSVYAGFPRALNAVGAAREVFADHGVSGAAEAPRAVAVAWLDAVARGDRSAAADLLADDVTAEVELEQLTAGEPLPAGDVVYVPGSFVYLSETGSEHRAGEGVLELRVRDGRIGSLRLHASR